MSENAESDKIRVTLSAPVNGPDGELTVLEFRKPRGIDLTEVGQPVKIQPFADPPDISFEGKKMTAMLSRLGNVPPVVINNLSANDWAACAWAVAPFFLPAT